MKTCFVQPTGSRGGGGRVTRKCEEQSILERGNHVGVRRGQFPILKEEWVLRIGVEERSKWLKILG